MQATFIKKVAADDLGWLLSEAKRSDGGADQSARPPSFLIKSAESALALF